MVITGTMTIAAMAPSEIDAVLELEVSPATPAPPAPPPPEDEHDGLQSAYVPKSGAAVILSELL